MSINLSKGGSINLTKEANNGLSATTVGLGWKQNGGKGKGLLGRLKGNFVTADVDASIIISKSDKTASETVFFGQESSRDGAIHHSGDNLVGGSGKTDDEQIKVDFSKLSSETNRLSVVINIYNAHHKHQTFSQIEDAYVHVMDENGNDLVRFELSNEYDAATGIIVGDFVKNGNDWHFNAVGRGVDVGRIDEFNQYL